MFCLGLCALAPMRAHAQAIRPIDVRGLRPLNFGDVLAGTSAAVDPDDAARAGAWVIRGERYSELLLDFTLPNALVGGGGAQLPVYFDGDDASYFAGHNPQPIHFDPMTSFIYALDRNGRVRVQLGGTVRAGFSQQSGPYRGTVTLTVAYTGN